MMLAAYTPSPLMMSKPGSIIRYRKLVNSVLSKSISRFLNSDKKTMNFHTRVPGDALSCGSHSCHLFSLRGRKCLKEPINRLRFPKIS